MLPPARSHVYPSAGAFSTDVCAIMPPAPGRFSMTNCWCRSSESFGAMRRVVKSSPPPGAVATTTRTGFCGQTPLGLSAARAEPARSVRPSAATKTLRLRFMTFSLKVRRLSLFLADRDPDLLLWNEYGLDGCVA